MMQNSLVGIKELQSIGHGVCLVMGFTLGSGAGSAEAAAIPADNFSHTATYNIYVCTTRSAEHTHSTAQARFCR
jgi:hypothetical protein